MSIATTKASAVMPCVSAKAAASLFLELERQLKDPPESNC
jgi:hypothetical protein